MKSKTKTGKNPQSRQGDKKRRGVQKRGSKTDSGPGNLLDWNIGSDAVSINKKQDEAENIFEKIS